MTDEGIPTIPEFSTLGEFEVNLFVQVAGPEFRRRKNKQYRLLRVEGSISLPFAPYPGLYLTFSKPHWDRRKRGPAEAQLRVRTVDWQVSKRCFECIADETFAREPGFETTEVRGTPHIEQHFIELQETFEHLGFRVSTDQEAVLWSLHKSADGAEQGKRGDYF